MSASPEPTDEARLAAYRAELRRVAAGPRMLGVMLAFLGLTAAVLRVWQRGIPRFVPIVLIVTALGLMALGIVRRTRYHLQRIRTLK